MKEHKIIVIYGNISSMEEDKIKEIRNALENFKNYDVSSYYDNDGYVNKITINNIQIKVFYREKIICEVQV